MRKILYTIVSVIISSGLCLFSACNFGEDKETEYISISTREELYAMESDKSYCLACDIDLAGGEWMPLSVKEFDGNGHTIRDSIIKQGVTMYNDETGVAFFLKANSVKNTNFEKITVMASKSNYVAVAACDMNGTIENVTVKNCTVSADNYDMTNNNGYTAFKIGLLMAEGQNVVDCHVENGTIKAVMSNIDTKIGLICGEGNGSCFSGCTVQGCEVIAEKINQVAIGGIVADQVEKIEECVVMNCGFTASDCVDCSVGGLGALTGKYRSVEALRTKSVGNAININTTNGYICGALFGQVNESVTDCLSSGNSINATATGDGDKIVSGGIAQGENPVNIQKCIVQNCIVKSDGISVGFIGNGEGSIVNCAVKNNVLKGERTDEFALKRENVRNSYIYPMQESFKNANGVKTVQDEEWLKIITTLLLDTDLWSMNSVGDLTLNN